MALATAEVPAYGTDALLSLSAPAATPKDVVKLINSAAALAMANPEFQTQLARVLARVGTETPAAGRPEGLATYFRGEVEKGASRQVRAPASSGVNR